MSTITINYDVKSVSQISDTQIAVSYVLYEQTTVTSKSYIEYFDANALNQGVLDTMGSQQVTDQLDSNFLTLIAANMASFTNIVQSKLSYLNVSGKLPTIQPEFAISNPLLAIKGKVDIKKD